jgi:hypothetical protein
MLIPALLGGGSEEIMSELALREESKDLRKYAKASTSSSKL